MKILKVYKENVIAALRKLTDSDFQKQAWLASSGPMVSSFIEDVCQLFDDTGLGDAFRSGQSVFGEKADQALHELSDIIDKVNYKVPPQELLDDPLVQKVREKAAEALQLIQSDSV